MMTRLKATKAERVAFYAEHDALLEKCSFMQGWFLGEDGQQLVKKARVRFKYSPATFTCDIMSTTVRGWTRGESKSTGPEEVSGDDGT